MDVDEDDRKQRALSLGKLKQMYKKKDKEHKQRMQELALQRKAKSKRTLDGKEAIREIRNQIKEEEEKYQKEKQLAFKEAEEREESKMDE